MKRSAARKNAYHEIKLMLLRRREIAQAVNEARSLSARSLIGGNGSGVAVRADPTGQEAVKNATLIPEITLLDGTTVKLPELWLRSINAGFNECTEYEQKFIKSMFCGNSVAVVAERFTVEPQTIYRVLNELIHVIAEAASYHQLIKTF